ncbi:MAG: 2-hydroxychromene-2-carboxylate isomerase, partial [Acidiferrobacterales bacterium]
HGRSVTWRPYLMGVVFKINGRTPLPDLPLVGDYARRDFARSARLHGVPFNAPSRLPISGVAASRAYYWVYDQDPQKAKALAQALYGAFFVDDKNIAEADVVASIAESVGIDSSAVTEALQDADVKNRLRQETDAAIARGVFGSPYVVVDDEPFWGNDRLGQVDRWLETGGW